MSSSWDTVGVLYVVILNGLSDIFQFRTFYPLIGLHSPAEFAQIVDSYIDGWRKNGWMPECRANNLPGWTQGGMYQQLCSVLMG